MRSMCVNVHTRMFKKKNVLRVSNAGLERAVTTEETERKGGRIRMNFVSRRGGFLVAEKTTVHTHAWREYNGTHLV